MLGCGFQIEAFLRGSSHSALEVQLRDLGQVTLPYFSSLVNLDNVKTHPSWVSKVALLVEVTSSKSNGLSSIPRNPVVKIET